MFRRPSSWAALVAVVAMAAAVNANITSGLIAYWNFEEGSGGTITDVSGNGHDGTVQGTVTHSTDACPFPGSSFACDFGDLAGHIQVPDHAALDPTGDFTFAAWVKNRPSSSYNGCDMILCKHNTGQNSDGSWMWGLDPWNTPHNPTGAGHFFIATPWQAELYGQSHFPLNEWHHVAMTYQDGSDTYTFYIDGVAQSGTYVANIMDNAAPLNIGGQEGNNDYAGLLDEVRMYNRALSADDIQELIVGPCQALVEDFPGPALAGWQSIGNGQWSWNAEASGIAKQTFGPQDDNLSVLKLLNKDFDDFELTVRWRQDAGPTISSGMEIMFRMGDTSGPGANVPGIGPYYSVGCMMTQAHYGSPDFGLGYCEGWQQVSSNVYHSVGGVGLASATLNESGNWFGLGQWRRTKIRVVADNIQVFVDHDSSNPAADRETDFVLVLNVTDSRLTHGRVALNDHYANSSWDYVRVRPVLLGDMNGDCAVTFADIDLFVEALAGESAWTHDSPWRNADCNNDGRVTFADIDPFVAQLGQ